MAKRGTRRMRGGWGFGLSDYLPSWLGGTTPAPPAPASIPQGVTDAPVGSPSPYGSPSSGPANPPPPYGGKGKKSRKTRRGGRRHSKAKSIYKH